MLQFAAGILNHVFSDRDFIAVLVDERAPQRLVWLRADHRYCLNALLTIHGLSPHQGVSLIIDPFNDQAVTQLGGAASPTEMP